MDDVRVEFDFKPKRSALKDNKKDLQIVKLRSQLHEVRQRLRDFSDTNERYTTLKSKFELLNESKTHMYEQGINNYRAE